MTTVKKIIENLSSSYKSDDPVFIRIEDVEAFLADKVIMSRSEYDKQVHVPRKQLSERIGQLERKINEGRAKVDGAEWLKNASEPATFVHYLQGRKDALEKELLEASK